MLLAEEGVQMFKKKGLLIFILIVVLLVGGVIGYIQTKHYTTKKEVKNYLITEKKIPEKDIEEMDTEIGNLSGDKNWLVSVKLKGDEGYYYYYFDRDKEKVELLDYTGSSEEE